MGILFVCLFYFLDKIRSSIAGSPVPHRWVVPTVRSNVGDFHMLHMQIQGCVNSPATRNELRKLQFAIDQMIHLRIVGRIMPHCNTRTVDGCRLLPFADTCLTGCRLLPFADTCLTGCLLKVIPVIILDAQSELANNANNNKNNKDESNTSNTGKSLVACPNTPPRKCALPRWRR